MKFVLVTSVPHPMGRNRFFWLAKRWNPRANPLASP